MSAKTKLVPCTCGKGFVVILTDGTPCCTATLARYEALHGKAYEDALACARKAAIEAVRA